MLKKIFSALGMGFLLAVFYLLLSLGGRQEKAPVQQIPASPLPSIGNVSSASLPDLDFAVINGNYASGAGICDTVLVTEDADSVAAQTYGNIVAVKEGNENNPAVLALVEALKSDTIKQYIKDTYNGIVMPME